MEYILKQRVTGALVLVALAVIFVPMLLEGPGDTLVPEMDALPDNLEQPFSGALPSFPAPDEVPPTPKKAVLLQDTGKTASEADAHDKLVPPPEITEQKPVKPGQMVRWVVQAGSFSSQGNALGLRDKLRKAKIDAQVEKVVVDGKTRFRVQMGPYLKRDEAEKANRTLETSYNLKGRVFAAP